MITSFHNGTGRRSSAAARPRAGISSHVGTPRTLGHTGRPGPQPRSARMATAVTAGNSAARAAMHQAVGGAKTAHRQATLHPNQHFNADSVMMSQRPFDTYRPGAPGRDPYVLGEEDQDRQRWARSPVHTPAGELWVYCHTGPGWGNQRFMVYNPRTGVWASFTPKDYIQSSDAGRAVCSATGAFGTRYAIVLGVTAGLMYGGGVMLATEGGTAALAAAYEGISAGWGVATRVGVRVVVRAKNYGSEIVKHFTVKNFVIKGSVNFITQFGSGWLTHEFNWKESLNNMNYTSVLLAGVLPEAEKISGMLGNAFLTSTFKGKIKITEEGTEAHFELPHFDSMSGVGSYMLDILTSVGSEKVKVKLLKKVGGEYGVKMTTWGDSGSSVLRWIAGQRVVLGTFGSFGAGLGIDATTDKSNEWLKDKLPGAEAAKRTEEAKKRKH